MLFRPKLARHGLYLELRQGQDRIGQVNANLHVQFSLGLVALTGATAIPGRSISCICGGRSAATQWMGVGSQSRLIVERTS